MREVASRLLPSHEKPLMATEQEKGEYSVSLEMVFVVFHLIYLCCHIIESTSHWLDISSPVVPALAVCFALKFMNIKLASDMQVAKPFRWAMWMRQNVARIGNLCKLCVLHQPFEVVLLECSLQYYWHMFYEKLQNSISKCQVCYMLFLCNYLCLTLSLPLTDFDGFLCFSVIRLEAQLHIFWKSIESLDKNTGKEET